MSARAKTSTASEARERAAGLEELLRARAYLFELFHKLTGAAPDADVLDALLGEETAIAVGSYAEDDRTMAGLARFLRELAAREDRAGLLDAARDEHTRLFVGPAAFPAPVWESPYRTKEPTLFQENTLSVRAAYRAHGLEPKRMQRVPDDHVALVCAFMALRSLVALAAFAAGDAAALAVELRDELAFSRAHATNWLGAFARAERRSKTSVLYPQLIEALAAFADVDAVFLAEAAYWAEGEDAADALAENVASLGEPHKALAALEALRPFGIEDYELVPVGRSRSRDAS